MTANHRSLAIGLGLPSVAVLVVMPLLADTSVYVLGIPLLFFWMFLCFPLTSLCLWVAWRIDRPRYPEDPPPARREEVSGA
ncbi:DUF3311 domain-containing protein [Streptomyces sp. NPDC090052]|uniref:DUF3311 domain-containing protein n=1 Tax=unclassified Streptomyces TaxID=2593676 RepID=UPI00224F9AE9|nr:MULTISPECIES: DUF3311 domain-containing protein [unclassified Streptomyces]MCX4728969.1 DUF3311 domain-containing protein [Streptomyces sp. NBC_01306]WSX46316.1 DUF3311 domain-containing protein [Streptomyces sp. NBC_00963]WSX65613.1 DUF3311 domain-containing protein [Streptomyces sp. NBC_00932]